MVRSSCSALVLVEGSLREVLRVAASTGLPSFTKTRWTRRPSPEDSPGRGERKAGTDGCIMKWNTRIMDVFVTSYSVLYAGVRGDV